MINRTLLVIAAGLLSMAWLAAPAEAGRIAPGAHAAGLGARNEQLYERLVAQRDRNPTKFDRAKPVLGRMFTDSSYFQYWQDRWQANPARFEEFHPQFWRIIDGEGHAGGPPVPIVVPPTTPPLNAPQGLDGGPSPSAPSDGGNPGSDPPGDPQGPSPGPPQGAVPEPGSSVLLISGLGLLAALRAARARAAG